MRALNYQNYGGLDELLLSELPVPLVADNEILIRVHAASINPFDWKLRIGTLRDFFDVPFPITPGRDGCGEIVALGKHAALKNDASVQIGERVVFVSSRMQHGSQAEYVAVKVHDFVAPAPANITVQQCAALPFVGLSAWCALVETAELKSGMKVLIHGGSGGIGSIAIQLAKHLGAEVYATCSTANSGFVEKLGASAIPYDAIDFTEVIADCDVVFDTVGGEVHDKSYTVLKNGGRLVYLIAKPFHEPPAGTAIESRQVNVINRHGNLHQVMDLAASGVLKANVSHAFPLADFSTAYQLVESGKSGGKVVLEIEDEKSKL